MTDDACEVCRQGQGQPRSLYGRTLPEETAIDNVDFHLCSGCHVSWEEYRNWQMGEGQQPEYGRQLRLLMRYGPECLTFFFVRWVIDRSVFLKCEEHRHSLKRQLKSRFISAPIRSKYTHGNDRNPG